MMQHRSGSGRSGSATGPHTRGEEGYILIGVILLLVVFVIAMAVAAPRIAASIQRDREVETMHRGKQYTRAIQLYYRKFQTYPPSIDALVKTNDIRFLRKKYIDPMTGKDDWKPIMFGQNKTPMAMGFFGQPLAGTGGAVVAGTGPSGGNGLAGGGLPGGSAPGSPTSGSSPFGGSSGSIFGGSTGSTSGVGGSSSLFGNNGTTSGTGTDTGTPGTATGSSGGTDANGNPTGDTGPTFGGGGIIGVSPASPKQSILTYKKKNHYNQWEFLYSPLSEQQMMSGGNAGTIGTPASGTNGTGIGTGSPFSNSPTGTTTSPTGTTMSPSPQ